MQPLPDFDQLWDFDKSAETEQKFRALLPEAKKSGDASYHAQLLTQIARAQGLQMKFDEAHTTLDEVEKMLTPQLSTARIRLSLERGRAFNSGKQREKARPLFVEALDAARAAGADGYAVDALHMIAIVDPPEAALTWNKKAMELAERSSDPKAKKWLGSLYNNIGWTHHNMGQYDKALEVFKKGLAWRMEHKQANEARVAKWTVARALRSLKRCDEALELQKQLEKEFAKSGEPDGYVYEELGECMLALGKADEARPHFKRAHELLAKDIWLAENEPARIARLEQLGAAR